MAIAVEEMKTALEEISSVFDGLIDRLGSGSRVFIKVDEWLGLSTRDAFMRCHVAVAKRRRPTAKDVDLEQAGWLCLGTVGDPTDVKAEILERRWKEYDSNRIYAFVSSVWEHPLSWRYPSSLEVIAPSEVWAKAGSGDIRDIVKQAQGDWAPLIAKGGYVEEAYVQLVPISHSIRRVSAGLTRPATSRTKIGGMPLSKIRRVSL